MNCELCDGPDGRILVRTAEWRIVAVEGAEAAAWPGFCRVIWNRHVREMTDLTATERNTLMETVWTLESALRTALSPAKINVASLGNMTPHLHWHVIPRWPTDAAWPRPIWSVLSPSPLPESGPVRRDDWEQVVTNCFAVPLTMAKSPACPPVL